MLRVIANLSCLPPWGKVAEGRMRVVVNLRSLLCGNERTDPHQSPVCELVTASPKGEAKTGMRIATPCCGMVRNDRFSVCAIF